MSGIFRKASADETEGPDAFIPIEKAKPVDPIKEFKKTILATEKQYHSKGKPFCRNCANIDYDIWVKQTAEEMQRSLGHKDFNKFNAKKPKLEVYGLPERFDFVKDVDAMEPTRDVSIGGIARSIKIGIHRDYRCKERGCGISIQISNDQLKEMSSVQQPKIETAQ